MLTHPTPTPRAAAQAVLQLVTDAQSTLRSVACEHGIVSSTLASWVTGDFGFTQLRKLQDEIVQLKRELTFVRESVAVMAQSRIQRYEYIKARSKTGSVPFMCRCLLVSKSAYYKWAQGKESAHRTRDKELSKHVLRIFNDFKGRYGYPRIHAELVEMGERVSQKRVARLMREQGLRASSPKRFVVTTISNKHRGIAPNRLKRDFVASAPNEKWVSDLTYIWTSEGWLYLCVIIALYARKIVGWSARSHMRDELVLEALENAIDSRGSDINFSGLTFHSDRGSQYASDDFIAALEDRHIQRSMSRRGNCWDNSVAESFFATLKKELIYRNRYGTREECVADIAEYIEMFYNAVRRHSYNEYLSPSAAERVA